MVTGMQGRAEMPELKILLGGIPLGCDNIGDEAILGCFTSLVRRLAPRAEITVCTAAEEDTAALLGVKTAPLYGFTREHPVSSFGRFVRKFDRYIWCGATGLSDYPAVGAGLLEAAQKQRVECVVWGVGMNSELNPAFFSIAGMRRKLLRAAELLTFGRVPFIDRCEARLDSRMRQRLAAALKGCSLVVVRDPQTAEELRRSGFDSAVVGADSAILQRTGKIPLVDREQVRIGFCVSAQRSIGQRAELLALWNRLTGRENYRLVLIPMNPKTDSALMRGLASGLEHPGDPAQCDAPGRGAGRGGELPGRRQQPAASADSGGQCRDADHRHRPGQQDREFPRGIRPRPGRQCGRLRFFGGRAGRRSVSGRRRRRVPPRGGSGSRPDAGPACRRRAAS